MSRYSLIAREDFEAHAKEVVVELERQRRAMYHALDILPATGGEKVFQARDDLNNEINASLGEQRAWRKMCEWVAENYPAEEDQFDYVPNFGLNER